MALAKKSWYTPKNTTHQILFILVITTTVSGLLIAIFRQSIHSSITEICHIMSTSSSPAPTTLTPFEANFTYQSLNPATDSLWDELVTPNGGFLLDESGDESQVYGVGMFHQLHCLQIFRNNLQEIHAKKDACERKGKGEKRGVPHGLHLDLGHTLHCMDYFRQVFLCFADASLEPSIVGPGGGLPMTNGMVPHQCRDPSTLYERSLAARGSHKHSNSASKGNEAQDHDH